jgi:hypothetical protein
MPCLAPDLELRSDSGHLILANSCGECLFPHSRRKRAVWYQSPTRRSKTVCGHSSETSHICPEGRRRCCRSSSLLAGRVIASALDNRGSRRCACWKASTGATANAIDEERIMRTHVLGCTVVAITATAFALTGPTQGATDISAFKSSTLDGCARALRPVHWNRHKRQWL